MGDSKALSGKEALAEIKRIAKDQIAMLCTFSAGGSMHSRPMGTLAIDDDGTFWFMSQRGSQENQEIAAHPGMHLLYAITPKSEYLALEGTAVLLRDQRKIDELWTPLAKAWFAKGKEDPDISLIKVTPMSGHYWDTKHNKVIQFTAIALGALTGKPMDDGVSGSLHLS